MKETTAAELNRALLDVTGMLDRIVSVAQDELSEEDFKECRRSVGAVMGEIYFEFLEDLWRRFPQLQPPGMRGTS